MEAEEAPLEERAVAGKAKEEDEDEQRKVDDDQGRFHPSSESVGVDENPPPSDGVVIVASEEAAAAPVDDVSLLKDELNAMKLRMEQLVTDLETHKDLLAQSEELARAYEEEMNASRAEAETKQHQLEEVTRQLEFAKDQFEARYNDLLAENQLLEKMSGEGAAYKEKLNKVMGQLADAREETSRLIEESGREVLRLKAQVEGLQEEKAVMDRKLQTAETQISNLEADARVYKGWWDYWQEKHDAAVEKATMLEDDLIEAHAKYFELSRRLHEDIKFDDPEPIRERRLRRRSMTNQDLFAILKSADVMPSTARTADGSAPTMSDIALGLELVAKKQDEDVAAEISQLQDPSTIAAAAATTAEPAATATEATQTADPDAEVERVRSKRDSQRSSIVPPLNLKGVELDPDTDSENNKPYQGTLPSSFSDSDSEDDDDMGQPSVSQVSRPPELDVDHDADTHLAPERAVSPNVNSASTDKKMSVSTQSSITSVSSNAPSKEISPLVEKSALKSEARCCGTRTASLESSCSIM